MENIVKNNIVLKALKKLSNDQGARFRFSTGLKLIGIMALTMVSLILFSFLFLKFDLLFFESHGFMKIPELSEAFYDSVLSTLENYYLPLAALFIVNYFLGVYIAHLLQRPFKLIADYCEAWVDGKTVTYSPAFFSELTLLTSFCELFFHMGESAKMNKKFTVMVTPEKYKNIHAPVFERSFFMHYGLFILITALASGVLLFGMAESMYEGIVKLSMSVLDKKSGIDIFLTGQREIFDYIIGIILSIHTFLFVITTIRLHSKVATPAFAIFSTMRAFSKGKFGNRIHLIGSYFLRDYCRSINKYLDHVQENYTD